MIADEQGNHAFSVTAEQFEADRQAAADAGLLVAAGDAAGNVA